MHLKERDAWRQIDIAFRLYGLPCILLRSQNAVFQDGSWIDPGSRKIAEKMSSNGYSEWFLLKDLLQIGDMVRSRKPPNSCKIENMEVKVTMVGLDSDSDRNGYVLVRVHGIDDPIRVNASSLERVTYGLAAGDWVRLKAEGKKYSPVGILHMVNRDGSGAVGFIGMETLWRGTCSELQLAETLSVGQFVRLKSDTFSPQFEWPQKRGGEWATGRICQVLPNGCLVVKFPGRMTFGDENCSFLADPAEVEIVSFDTCPGIVKKYQHLEDFHWAVRPLLIALGLFTAMKLGLFYGKKIGRSKMRKGRNHVTPAEGQPLEGQTAANAAWLPPKVANIIFREGVSTPTS